MFQHAPRPNKTKAMLSRGEIPFGTFLSFPSPRIVELCGVVGLDFVVVDCEGGPLDSVLAEDIVRAAEAVDITPIIRPMNHDPKAIQRFLDSGFQGLMVPGVDSAEQARAIHSASKYPPTGTRGLGLARAAWYGQSTPISEYTEQVNREILVIAMIEHANALRELDAILETPGIDGFEIGQWDLAASMGYAGNTSHPRVCEAVELILRTATGSGRVVADTVGSADEAKALIDQGFRMLNCSFPLFVGDALRRLSEGVREVSPPRTSANT